MTTSHSRWRLLAASAACFLPVACSAPESRRLDLASDLEPPASEEVRVLAAAMAHPILKPIAFDDSDGLSADEAAILAVIAHPALRAARVRRRLAGAQLLQAGILPNPELSFDLAVPVGPNAEGVTTGYGFGLSWEVTSLLARAARQQAATAQATAVDLEIAWQEWQVSQAARLHVRRLDLLLQEIAAAAAVVESVQAGVEIVRRSVELGGASAIELATAEAALIQASASRLQLEEEQQSERLQLNQALGLPPETVVRLEEPTAGVAAASFSSDAPPPSASEALAGIEENRLDLVALRHGYESQEAKLRAAVRGRFPRIRLGLLGGRDAGEIETVGFGVSVELPIFDRNQGAIAVEEASRDALFEEYRSRLFAARHQVAQMLAALEATQGRLRLQESGAEALRRLVPGLELMLQQGTIAATEYFRARRDLAEQELELIRLRRTLVELRIGLEIAVGRYCF